jgi:hypothetical protein
MNLELEIENPKWKYKRKERAGGVQYIFTFKNGYGASVVKFWGTYGYEEDLWELAVLKNGSLHYDNPVADGDVCGDLTDEEVNNLLREIESFKGVE